VNDITLLYYTSNQISDFFANNVRKHLMESSNWQYPVISISQRPIDFGKNIYVKGLVPSIYNIYKQILIGAKEATTKYIACCEDDCLYVPGYFEYQPSDDETFAYNTNNWNCDEEFFFFRERNNMCMCIAPRELIIDTLEKRFEKYPVILPREKLQGFGEPGRYEHTVLGLPRVKRESFQTEPCTITFNHRPSMGGMRKVLERHKRADSLPYWGNAKELRSRIYASSST
jgi:hypothetical protein